MIPGIPRVNQWAPLTGQNSSPSWEKLSNRVKNSLLQYPISKGPWKMMDCYRSPSMLQASCCRSVQL